MAKKKTNGKYAGCRHSSKVKATVIPFAGDSYEVDVCETCAGKFIESDNSWKLDVAAIEMDTPVD